MFDITLLMKWCWMMIVCVLSLLMLKDIDLWTVNEDEFSSVNDDDCSKCWLGFVA